jgi:hypothetical protein
MPSFILMTTIPVFGRKPTRLPQEEGTQPLASCEIPDSQPNRIFFTKIAVLPILTAIISKSLQPLRNKSPPLQ